jgi:putative flavoprotein involved in K+ transport
MDEYALANSLDLPEEPVESSAPTCAGSASPNAILELDIESAGISVVIWATGFLYDFNSVKLPVFDDGGEPLQQRGVSPCPGFYFLGLRRMHTVKSNIFEGVGDDAAYIAEHLATRS